MAHTFRKSERLNSQRVIDEIFSKGKELRRFPFILKFLPLAEKPQQPVQIAISVPKKKAKRAVDRNRLRRQIKEAYRLNKSELQLYFEKKGTGIALFLIYTGNEKENYALLEEKLKLILRDLIKTFA